MTNKVILTKQTQAILKNFATINSSILFRKGSKIKTISVGENAVAEYDCEEDFPKDFGIYDLGQFLQGLELFTVKDKAGGVEPVLEFENDSFVTIHGGGKAAAYTARYFFSSPEITLKAAPEKDINFPAADMEFSIDPGDLDSLQKAAQVYKLPDLSFKSDEDGCIKMEVCDREDPTCNVYAQRIKGHATGSYQLYMKMDNIRVHSGGYNVKVSKNLITEWKHTGLDLTYYIALEP
tara:strand:+ start:634 stop:1341 length:708 start_codon:yes stop_codon:yes gene_type:complete